MAELPQSVAVSSIDQRHEAYDADEMAQRHALYTGGRAWHDLASVWLPCGAMEPRALYDERIRGARYTNYTATVLDLIASQLFGVEPGVEVDGADADTETQVADLTTAADGGRLGLPALARLFFSDALLYGRAWCLVEQPAASREVFASRAEQESAGALRAYLRRFDPRAVINWRLDGSVVSWVVAREDVTEQATPLAPAMAVARWTVLTSEVVAVYEWREAIRQNAPRPAPQSGDTAQLVASVRHGRRTVDGMPLCPVVVMDVPPGMDAGAKLKDPAARLARSENELDWGLYRGANELLIVRSVHPVGTPTLGAGYFLSLEDPDAEAYFIGPSGMSLGLLSERCDRQRMELYRVVQQMALAADPSAGRAGASADSKAQDWAASDRMLAGYATEVRDFLAEAVRQALSVRTGAPVDLETVKVRGLDGWQRETTATWLEQVAQAIEAKAMSPRFVAEVAKQQARRCLGEEADEAVLQEISDQIDAAADGLAPGTGLGVYGGMAGNEDAEGADDGNRSTGDGGASRGGGTGGDPGRGRRERGGRAGRGRRAASGAAGDRGAAGRPPDGRE